MTLRGSKLQWEVTADIVEITRELEPEDVSELLHSHDKTLMNVDLLSMDERFLR